MDDAMGLGKSWLSAVVLGGGITGFLTAGILEFGPSWLIYPLVVHGKPTNWATVPAFFPIMFELTVLFSAFLRIFRGADHERTAALAPPDFQLGTFQPRDKRWIFPCDRGARPALY